MITTLDALKAIDTTGRLFTDPEAPPCKPGVRFIEEHGHKPAREVLDLALTTVAGCAFVRWLSCRLWGDRALTAIDKGHRQCVRSVRPLEWHEETTREVAGWLRDEIERIVTVQYVSEKGTRE